jgi:hypothetical protein
MIELSKYAFEVLKVQDCQLLGSAFATIVADRPSHASCLLGRNLSFCLAHWPHGVWFNC